jgi:hypothetical protein
MMIKSESISGMYRELSTVFNYVDDKFVCLNDNRDYDSPFTEPINIIVNALYQTLFPYPS